MALPEKEEPTLQSTQELSVERQDTPSSQRPHQDVEKQAEPIDAEEESGIADSMFKSLGVLDRFLAVWIFLAMAIGIILGNFVPSTGPALQKGTFVGVSIPIGMSVFEPFQVLGDSEAPNTDPLPFNSCRTVGHDVPHPLQSSL